MVAMIAAMNALGPAHQIVGAIVSLGANDLSGADYNIVWIPQARQFITDLRAQVSLPALTIAWAQCAADYERGSAPGYIDSNTPLGFRVAGCGRRRHRWMPPVDHAMLSRALRQW